MIAIRNLTLDFQTHEGVRRVLNDISLEIADGQFVALMGANGSGKTSLARCLNGILLPSSGRVMIDGLDTRNAKDLIEICRRLGMVFQNPDNQIVAPTVEREIAFGPENLGVPRPEMHRRVNHLLELFHLEPYRRQAPHLLSGGEKQRVALAAVMAMQPRHIVFDEPTSLLDYESRCQVLALMQQLASSPNPFSGQPVTIVLITQFPEEALFAERLLVLDNGRMVMDGPPREIFLRVDELQQLGLQPPIEFMAYTEAVKNKNDAPRLEDFLLSPIL
ncbi:MAG: ATP-binding cassette domain-containing protein [candidate division KSB1 bacterium]|nr:ATP-binding cassette domain-containing protein [candidate division KSB1 bacterium]MDZ7366498.1 ATP-binding cassette domain-containing protein [candidate division KSB1 bacterium]MDZ7404540.1 ATP-binding cassette domain-containing protein [candidate division KSB1 bacterium]